MLAQHKLIGILDSLMTDVKLPRDGGYHAMTITTHAIQLLPYVTITTKKFMRPQFPDADRLTFAIAPFLMETS